MGILVTLLFLCVLLLGIKVICQGNKMKSIEKDVSLLMSFKNILNGSDNLLLNFKNMNKELEILVNRKGDGVGNSPPKPPPPPSTK